MKSMTLAACVLIVSTLFSIQASVADNAPASNDVFLLQQLIKLQQEISGLRQDINELKELVKEHQAGPVATAPAPAPQQNAPPQVAALYEVALDTDTPLLGDEAARIAIVEFSDFECPYCANFHTQTFSRLRSDYVDQGKIRYAVRHLPLDFHKNAKSAAIAASCAAQQDMFWEMQGELFTNQKQLGPDLYTGIADRLGLDAAAFEKCLGSEEALARVNSDLGYAASIGVTGTPTFFVGRLEGNRLVDATKIVGSASFDSFRTTVEQLLQGK